MLQRRISRIADLAMLVANAIGAPQEPKPTSRSCFIPAGLKDEASEPTVNVQLPILELICVTVEASRKSKSGKQPSLVHLWFNNPIGFPDRSGHSWVLCTDQSTC